MVQKGISCVLNIPFKFYVINKDILIYASAIKRALFQRFHTSHSGGNSRYKVNVIFHQMSFEGYGLKANTQEFTYYEDPWECYMNNQPWHFFRCNDEKYGCRYSP